MENKTSVIITTHNYAGYLEKCIDSLFNQSVVPLEIIVVNDSSSDNTDDIVRKYENKKNFHYHVVNFKSAQKSRNFGLKKARGEYILNLDADNYLGKTFIEETQEVLDSKPKISLVYTDHLVFGEDSLVKMETQGNRWYSKKFNYSNLKESNYIDTASLVRKEGFDGFDERIRRFQDWDAWLTFLKNRKAYRISKPLLFKRLHRESKTMTVGVYIERLKVMLKHGLFRVCTSRGSSIELGDVSGNITCMIVADESGLNFINKLISESPRCRKLFFYIRDVGDLEKIVRIKKILKEEGAAYRVYRKLNVDGALKGFRKNKIMPAHKTDYLLIVNKWLIGDSNLIVPNKKREISFSVDGDIFLKRSFNEIDFVFFNKRGLRGFLNP